MSYTINLTNATTLATLSDGTIDQSHTSLTLIGRNYAGYGQFLNENFVKLLENFANPPSNGLGNSTDGPPNPLKGQLWWDTRNNILRVWTGNSWKISTGATAQSSAPTDVSAIGGDLWFDTVNVQLKVYTGSAWVTIGPQITPATGNTGAFPTTMYDTNVPPQSHVVIQFQIQNTVYAILAKEGFSTTLTGFASIVPGLNLSTNYLAPQTNIQSVLSTPNTLVQRDATAGINANAVTATSVISGVVNATNIYGNFSGNLAGNVSAGVVNATTVTSQAFIAGSGYVGNILTANQSRITTVGTLTSLTVSGDIIPSANLSVNLGSNSYWFNNIYGTAIHAQYADLAERFASDQAYPPGTVVEMGGTAEITAVGQDLSENVLGVISTSAAYLMNSGAGNNSTHPPVAVQGRVPVRVIGTVRKGDRLVSAGNGMARAGQREELSTWNVIGRALENKNDTGPGTIEAVVRINT